MTHKAILALLLSLLFTVSLEVEAIHAQRREPFRVGVLTDSWGPPPGVVGLRDGLVKLGYKENTDFFIGVRFTQGNVAALDGAARELVSQGVHIIFTNNPAPAKAAQQATDRIPIVFYGAGDPIGLGLVESFARPGSNVTGITDLDLERDTKRLEIFKEMIPGLKRVLFAYDSRESFSRAQAQVYRETARLLNLVLIEKPLSSRNQAKALFAEIDKSDVHGIVVPRSLSFNIPGIALETSPRKRIPTMFFGPWYVEHGGLASYGTNFYESGRMAARLVDKIFKGAKPAQLPVEVNSNIELVINLKVAQAMDVKISPQVLYRANRVIR